MNQRRKNYSLLTLGFILILCLVYLGQTPTNITIFHLLFIPLIFFAGYLEETTGALIMTLLAVVAIVGFFVFQFLPQEVALADVLALGLIFGLVAWMNHDREVIAQQWRQALEPQEKELQQLERKAHLTRAQIERYERRLKALVRLYEVTKKLSGILELQTMLDEARSIIAKIMSQHFSAQAHMPARLAFYIPEENSRDFQRSSSHGHEITDEGFPEHLSFEDLRQWLGEDFSSIRIKDLAQDPRFQPWMRSTPFRSLLVISLVMHELVIGLMLVASPRPGAFTPLDFNQAEVLGKQVVFALRKALLYRKVQMLSYTDSQTGLYVHRFFQDRLREEIHRAERYRQFLSLIMLDMDHFKQVNDQYGHQVGDAVLVEAAARIQEMSGSTAIVARYGGEEFAVLLPSAPKARAVQVAENINSFIKATPIDVGGSRLRVTISGGVSTYPEDALDRETLINTADTALYDAKRNGRDLIVAYRRAT